MQTFHINEKEFKKTVVGYCPFIQCALPIPYRNALIQKLVDSEEIEAEIFSHARGKRNFRPKGRMKNVSSHLDLSAFLGDKINTAYRETKRHMLIVLDIPSEQYLQMDIQAHLLELAEEIQTNASTFRVLLQSERLPEIYSSWSIYLDLSIPRMETRLTDYVSSLLNSYLGTMAPEDPSAIVESLRGLPAHDIEKVIASVAHNASDRGVSQLLKRIQKEREGVLEEASGLVIVEPKVSLQDLGGFNYLKRYLQYQAYILQNAEHARQAKVDMPKGFLLLGLPGCGKSLAAEAAAKTMNLPLLKMDIGSMMEKYLGESERNLKQALQVAEASAPCILWVDEIEKALGGMHSDEGGGTGKRMLGYLLNWMQSQSDGVFLIATANAVKKKLPPELLRRGRFDELFCVNLPTKEERENIAEIHLSKRDERLSKSDLAMLAKEVTKGYTGADIAALIRESKLQSWVQGESKISLNQIKKVAKRFTAFKDQFKGEVETMQKDLKKMGFRPVSMEHADLEEILSEIKEVKVPLLRPIEKLVASSLRKSFVLDDPKGWFLVIDGARGLKKRTFGFTNNLELEKFRVVFRGENKEGRLFLKRTSGSFPGWMQEGFAIELSINDGEFRLNYTDEKGVPRVSNLFQRKEEVRKSGQDLPKELLNWLFDDEISRVHLPNYEEPFKLKRSYKDYDLLPIWKLKQYSNHVVADYYPYIQGSRIFLLAEKAKRTPPAYGFFVAWNQGNVVFEALGKDDCLRQIAQMGKDENQWVQSIERDLSQRKDNFSMFKINSDAKSEISYRKFKPDAMKQDPPLHKVTFKKGIITFLGRSPILSYGNSGRHRLTVKTSREPSLLIYQLAKNTSLPFQRIIIDKYQYLVRMRKANGTEFGSFSCTFFTKK